MIRFFIFFMLVFLTEAAHAQNRFTIAPNIGYYLYHSDNHLPVTRDENLIVSYGIGAGWEFSLKDRLRAQIELTYFRTDLPEAYRSVVYDDQGRELGNVKIYMLHQFVSIDASVVKTLNNGLTLGAGPSLTNCNRRTFSPRMLGMKAWPKDDAFNVLGIGLQAFARAGLNTSQSIFAACKFRLNTALIKFENGRDLSGYSADFIHVQLSLGYAFGKRSRIDDRQRSDIRI